VTPDAVSFYGEDLIGYLFTEHQAAGSARNDIVKLPYAGIPGVDLISFLSEKASADMQSRLPYSKDPRSVPVTCTDISAGRLPAVEIRPYVSAGSISDRSARICCR
jgi:hypothetical protein